MANTGNDALRLQLFGVPQVRTATAGIPLPETAPAFLLLYLAALRGWAAREHVAALLWPTLDEVRAQHNLRVALNRAAGLLQRWGARSALVAERRRLRLDLASDLADFHAAVAAGRWGRACELATGEVLQGVGFAPYPALAEWLVLERETVRTLWRRALREAARAATLPEGALERFLQHHPDDGGALDLAASPRTSPAASGPAGAAAPIGREAELAALNGLLQVHRVVTLVGLPGIGKSTLARQWAQAARTAGTARVALIELGERSTAPALLEQAWQAFDLGAALRVPPHLAIDRLAGVTGVLVLDGIDQAPPDALAAVREIVTRPAVLRLLLTARQPQGVGGERLFTLTGLSTRGECGPSTSPAGQLFLREASRWAPTHGDPAAVGRIVAAAGGVPLIIKLAAGWMRWLDAERVAADLEAFDGTGAQPMHLPLEALLSATWKRLAADQRAALEALSLWPRAFDMADAAGLSGASPELVECLADVGLLERTRPDDGPGHPHSRLRLQPMVRQFAARQLAAAPARQRALGRRLVEAIGRRLGARHVVEGQPVVTVDRVAPLVDEVLQAWHLALQVGEVQALTWLLAGLLAWFEAKGQFRAGVQVIERAAEALDDAAPAEAAVLARVHVALATLRYREADYDAAADTGRLAQRLAQASGQPRVARRAANIVGLSLWMQHRLDDAHAIFSACLVDARTHDDLLGETVFGSNLALIDNVRGAWHDAEARWLGVLELDRRQQRWEAACSVLNNLGNLYRHQGRLDEAEVQAREALRLSREHGLDAVRPFAIIGLALLQACRGQDDTALQYLDLLAGCEPASVEGPVRASAHNLHARIAIRRSEAGPALDHIAAAIEECDRHDDAANRLEALLTYGLWLLHFESPAPALDLWRGLAAQPILHASMRGELQALLQAHAGADDSPKSKPLDVTLSAERVLVRARRGGALG